MQKQFIDRKHLKNRERYLKNLLDKETVVLIKLDLTQKIINNQKLLKNSSIFKKRKIHL